MVLWRPSKNNQRYAFTPLLDRDEDYSSEEEDDILYSDAWEGLKMRNQKTFRPDTPEGKLSIMLLSQIKLNTIYHFLKFEVASTINFSY